MNKQNKLRVKMVCLQSPSSIFIVICGWLQSFMSAKGKKRIIRKKLKIKEQKILEG